MNPIQLMAAKICIDISELEKEIKESLLSEVDCNLMGTPELYYPEREEMHLKLIKARLLLEEVEKTLKGIGI